MQRHSARWRIRRAAGIRGQDNRPVPRACHIPAAPEWPRVDRVHANPPKSITPQSIDHIKKGHSNERPFALLWPERLRALSPLEAFQRHGLCRSISTGGNGGVRYVARMLIGTLDGASSRRGNLELPRPARSSRRSSTTSWIASSSTPTGCSRTSTKPPKMSCRKSSSGSMPTALKRRRRAGCALPLSDGCERLQ